MLSCSEADYMRSTAGEWNAEAESSILSGGWSVKGQWTMKGGDAYRTRNTTTPQPFGPLLLTWAKTHFGLGSWLFIGLDPRSWWVREDGIVGTG